MLSLLSCKNYSQKYSTIALAAVHLMSVIVCASAAASSCFEGCGGATRGISWSCDERLEVGTDRRTLCIDVVGEVGLGEVDVEDDVNGCVWRFGKML